MEEKNIEMNGVTYEIKSLIEFSSLGKLLFDLAKRQKDMENNFLFIKNSINNNNSRLSDIEKKIFGEAKNNKKENKENIVKQISKELNSEDNLFQDNNNISDIKDENINENIFNDNNSYKNENNNQINFSEKPSININENKVYDREVPKNIEVNTEKENDNKNLDISNQNNHQEKEQLNTDSKLNPELISKLFKRVSEIEKKINLMNKDIFPQIKSNSNTISNSNNKIDELAQDYEEISKKFIKFNEEFDKLKIKVEDFNIYDIFKGESGEGGNIDASKALIMNLENKINKRFELLDAKNKKIEEDTFKVGENIKGIKSLVDNLKNLVQRNNDKIAEIENNLKNYCTKNNETIDELKNKIGLLEQQKSNEIENNNILEKIKEIENRLNNVNTKSEVVTIVQNKEVDPSIDKKFEEVDNTIKEIKKSMNQIEKNTNKKISDENKILNDKLNLLEKEIQSKANEKEILPLNGKIYDLEELIKSLNSVLDNLQEYNEKFKTDINNIFKKLEYFDGEIFQLKNEQDKNSSKKFLNFDQNSFLSQTNFNYFKKELATKLEKMKTDLENLSHNYENIFSSLNHLSSKKDFNSLQNNMINLIEDIKSTLHKKYVEKQEIQKTIKYMENQIKSLNESLKKYDGSENWLLAKRPIGIFQCASCEANLKDLEQKDNFVAWNRYPSREDKKYRMGHGYSRLLEMVNEEVIKNFEGKDIKDNKGYVSDEDKKYLNTSNSNNSKNVSKINDVNTSKGKISIKLPKVNKKILNLNKTNDKFEISSNNKFVKSASPYEEEDSAVIQDEPKVTKIYKKNIKKYDELNKNKIENINHIDINIDRKNKNNKDDNEYIHMNLTMPNNI